MRSASLESIRSTSPVQVAFNLDVSPDQVMRLLLSCRLVVVDGEVAFWIQYRQCDLVMPADPE